MSTSVNHNAVQIVQQFLSSVGLDRTVMQQTFQQLLSDQFIISFPQSGNQQFGKTDLINQMQNLKLSFPDFSLNLQHPRHYVRAKSGTVDTVETYYQAGGTHIGQAYTPVSTLVPIATTNRYIVNPREIAVLRVQNGQIVSMVVEVDPHEKHMGHGGFLGLYVLLGGVIPDSSIPMSNDAKVIERFFTGANDVERWLQIYDQTMHPELLDFIPGMPAQSFQQNRIWVKDFLTALQPFSFGFGGNGQQRGNVFITPLDEVTYVVQYEVTCQHSGAWSPVPEVLPALPATGRQIKLPPEQCIVKMKDGKIWRSTLRPIAGVPAPLLGYQMLGGDITPVMQMFSGNQTGNQTGTQSVPWGKTNIGMTGQQ